MKDNKKLNIKDWSEDDRPREKLLRIGVEGLSKTELIAIIIGSGNRNKNAVDLSKEILSEVQSKLNNLAKYTIEELKRFDGIGEAKAISIIAALEIARRRNEEEIEEKTQLQSSRDIYKYMHPKLCGEIYEQFWAIYLDTSNKIIKSSKICAGGINSTTVDIRKILKEAILNSAVSIVVCHNHPSGNVIPSKMDIQVTQKIKDAALLLDMRLLDHIIISDSNYYSFSDEENVII
ncbi:MAG: hypothetical protein A2X02_02035 [Bacteroidetes bacterium GWF2_29_10]|nr:MAG: hypothetical protein A2X02_02035 [Bacteroidetes bacterium GWF2_29_10]